MLTKTVKIGDQDVVLRNSAALPRMYRTKFGRDIFKDLTRMHSAYEEAANAAQQFSTEDLEVFEDLAYVMNKLGDPSVPDDVDAWLDQFEMFSIHQVLPEILSLWSDGLGSLEVPGKNAAPPHGK